MKKQLHFLAFIGLLSLIACTPSLEKRLQKKMILHPQSMQEVEHNRILQYAINHDLDVKSTPSGIFYVIEEEGKGPKPSRSANITAHYESKLLLTGRTFDSTYEKGEPLTFKLDDVIVGWQESIPLLSKGGKGTFIIPSRLAYGEEQVGPVPPHSVLVFDIELLDFNNRS